MEPDFHARYDARARTYRYRVGTRAEAASPFLSPPGRWLDRRVSRPVGQVCTYRPAPLAAAALRVARDRPFRAVCLQ